ncbi:unnamed protein product [Schistocephalus solidus]|uniref:Clathrin light chain n=1 Tax=Schistocephalus solidus TaxID=70667 RepID=A0A183T639_SCHSO|nr:unnamed protein product [Schistocephalus solidus]
MTDPVQDFLAREKDALGDIANELGGDSSDVGSLDDLRDASELARGPSSHSPAASGDQPANDDSHAFQSGFVTVSPHLSAAEESRPRSSASSHASSHQSTKEKVPVTPLASALMESWRANFEANIRERDEREEQKRQELEANAKRELETWYSNYRSQLAARSTDNRSEAPKDASGKVYNSYSGPKPSINDSQVWDSVCSMCDLQV